MLSSSLELSSQIIHSVAQGLVSAAQTDFRDPRIENIVGGVALVLGGTSMLATSGALPRIKAWYQNTKPPIERLPINNVVRWSGVVLGLLCICYGIYMIACEIFDFQKKTFTPFPYTPISPFNPLDSTNTAIPLCERPDLWSTYESNISDTINGCSATNKLGNLANEISSSNNLLPWHVKIVRRGSQFADGAAAWLEGEVRIQCDAKEPVSIAAFELTNFTHQNLFSDLWNKALWGQVDRNQYAEIAEKIEFTGTQIHHSLMEECIKESGWKPTAQIWTKNTWENWWSYVSTTDHAEFHRKSWDRSVPAQFINKPIFILWNFFMGI